MVLRRIGAYNLTFYPSSRKKKYSQQLTVALASRASAAQIDDDESDWYM